MQHPEPRIPPTHLLVVRVHRLVARIPGVDETGMARSHRTQMGCLRLHKRRA